MVMMMMVMVMMITFVFIVTMNNAFILSLCNRLYAKGYFDL